MSEKVAEGLEPKTYEFLGAAYWQLFYAERFLRRDFGEGKLNRHNFEADQEEIADLIRRTRIMAENLGWRKPRG